MTKSVTITYLQIIVAVIIAMLAFPNSIRSQQPFTIDEFKALHKSKSAKPINVARNKYSIKVVNVIPLGYGKSFFDYFKTDEAMIGYALGEYLICCDDERVFYLTPTMKGFLDGTVRQKVEKGAQFGKFKYYLKKFIPLYRKFKNFGSSMLFEKMETFSEEYNNEYLNGIKANPGSFGQGNAEILLMYAKEAGITQSINFVKNISSLLDRGPETLLQYAKETKMPQLVDFATKATKAMQLQHQRLTYPRPALPSQDATDEERIAYNKKVAEYVQINRAEIDQIIRNIELSYGPKARDVLLNKLDSMRQSITKH